MLKLKQNMKFKCLEPIRTNAGSESLNERINSNYQQISTHFEKEDLLHLVMNSPEIFLEDTPMTNLIENNNIQNTQQIKVDMINNILNRIMLLNTQEFSYHDTVYISNVLKKLGIQDVNLFLKEIYDLQQETDNTSKLTKLYNENLSNISKYIKEYSQSKYINDTGNNDNNVTYDNRVFYLQDEVFSRLDTAQIYNEVMQIHTQIPGKEKSILNNEIRLSEQKRFANAYNMQNTVNNVHNNNMPFTYLRENIYEEGGDIFINEDAEVINKLTSAILLSLSDNIYTIRKHSIDNKNEWYDFKNIISQTSQNTIDRIEAYYKNNVDISISNHEYAQSIQNDRKVRVQLTNKLIENIKENKITSLTAKQVKNIEDRMFQSLSEHENDITYISNHEKSVSNETDTFISTDLVNIENNLENTSNELEINSVTQNNSSQDISKLIQDIDKSTDLKISNVNEFSQQHLEFLESLSKDEYIDEDNSITNVEMLKQQLDTINRQNVERFKQMILQKEEKAVRTNVVIDRKKAMQDTLRALENPDEVLGKYGDTQENGEVDTNIDNLHKNNEKNRQNQTIYDIINNVENYSKTDVSENDFIQVSKYHNDIELSENIKNEFDNTIDDSVNRVQNVIDNSVNPNVTKVENTELSEKKSSDTYAVNVEQVNKLIEGNEGIIRNTHILEKDSEYLKENVDILQKSLETVRIKDGFEGNESEIVRAIQDEKEANVSSEKVHEVIKNLENTMLSQDINNEFSQVDKYYTDNNIKSDIDNYNEDVSVDNNYSVDNKLINSINEIVNKTKIINETNKTDHSNESNVQQINKIQNDALETQNNVKVFNKNIETINQTLDILEKPNTMILRYLNEKEIEVAADKDNAKLSSENELNKKIKEIVRNTENASGTGATENPQVQQVDRYINSIVYDIDQNISEQQQEQLVNILHNEQSTVDESLTLNSEVNNKETLKQQLDRINQNNVERYLKLKESRQELNTVNNNMIDKKAAIRDSLTALTEPKEVIMTYLSQTTPEELKEQKQEDTLKALMSEDTKKIFEVLEDIAHNPQTRYVNSLRPVDLELVTKDVELHEKQSRETEKIERENRLKESEQKLVQEIRESKNQVRQINDITYNQDKKINFIHKVMDTTFTDEILESLEQQREMISSRNRIDKNISQSTVEKQNYEQINTINSNITRVNENNINEMVRDSIRTEIGNISDKVYAQIEKKLTMERKRRGY